MKLLSIAVPCYNSQDYMEKCIHSLLPGGEEVEILIVDDGSKDHTAEIADRLAAEHPTIIRAIHQENGGHGEAVNTGIANATGLYFKVVDSDDWVGEEAYQEILNTLRQHQEEADQLDLVISNYIYDKQGAVRKKVMQFRKSFPKNQVFGWEETRRLPAGKYLLMHTLIYRRKLLLDCGLHLPAHTFYVDNLFAYEPLPYVKKMYYVDVDFYHYFIGREDQSVHESVMIRRIEQQLKVNRRMIEAYGEHDYSDKHLKKYMISYANIITTVSSIMLIRSGTEDALEKKKQLWKYIKETNPSLYRAFRCSLTGFIINLPGSVGRFIAVIVYKITQKIYGFN